MAKNRDFPGGKNREIFPPPGAPRPPPGENFQKFRKFQKSGSREDFGDFGGALHPPGVRKISDAEIFSGRKKNFRRKKNFFGRKKKFFSPPQEKNFFFPARNALRASTP